MTGRLVPLHTSKVNIRHFLWKVYDEAIVFKSCQHVPLLQVVPALVRLGFGNPLST